MASQAESLQQLMGFFQVKDGHDGGAMWRPAAPRPVAPPTSAPQAPHAALRRPATRIGRLDGTQASDHEFKRF